MKEQFGYESMFVACHMDHGIAISGSDAGLAHATKDHQRVVREFQFGVGIERE